MSDESASFSTARVRLEEIVTQVRKKDTSLEKSLDLLEEGVRLANACTELIDRADWTVGGVVEQAASAAGSGGATAQVETDASGAVVAAEGGGESGDASASDPATPADEIVDGAPEDAAFASDDDAFGDAADEAWANDTPEYRDDES